jgi:hypothetical protein
MVEQMQPSAAASREAHSSEAWLTAHVPGPVHTDLQARLSTRSLADTF